MNKKETPDVDGLYGFGRGWQQQQQFMGVRPSTPQGQQDFGAPSSLEIDKEAEQAW